MLLAVTFLFHRRYHILWPFLNLFLTPQVVFAQTDPILHHSRPNALCFHVNLATLSSSSEPFVDVYMSHEACLAYCHLRQFPIGLVYKGSTCRCTSALTGTLAEAQHCQLPCTGYPLETCGGSKEEPRNNDHLNEEWIYVNKVTFSINSRSGAVLDGGAIFTTLEAQETSSSQASASSATQSLTVTPKILPSKRNRHDLPSAHIASTKGMPLPIDGKKKRRDNGVELSGYKELEEEEEEVVVVEEEDFDDGEEDKDGGDNDREGPEEHKGFNQAAPSKGSVDGTEKPSLPKNPFSLTIPIVAGASAVAFLLAVATLFICIGLRNRRRQAAFLAMLHDRRRSIWSDRYSIFGSITDRRQRHSVFSNMTAMEEAASYSRRYSGIGRYSNHPLTIHERDIPSSTLSKDDALSTVETPIAPSMRNAAGNLFGHRSANRPSQPMSSTMSPSNPSKKALSSRRSTFVNAPREVAFVARENEARLGMSQPEPSSRHRHSYPYLPVSAPLSHKHRPISVQAVNVEPYGTDEATEIKDPREPLREFSRPPSLLLHQPSFVCSYQDPYLNGHHSHQSMVSGSATCNNCSGEHLHSIHSSSASLPSHSLSRPFSVQQITYDTELAGASHQTHSYQNHLRSITSPIEAVAVSTFADSLHPHVANSRRHAADSIMTENLAEAPEYHCSNLPDTANLQGRSQIHPLHSHPPSMLSALAPSPSILEASLTSSNSFSFPIEDQGGWQSSTGPSSKMPLQSQRRHSVSPLISTSPLTSTSKKESSQNIDTISKECPTHLVTHSRSAGITFPKETKAAPDRKDSMLEQHCIRQNRLQRLSFPYVRVIRQQHQQHSQYLQGFLSPLVLSPKSPKPPTAEYTLPSIEEGIDGSSVVPDLLRTPPTRLSIAERLKQGSQRIRSHSALAAAIARHASESQKHGRIMMDGMSSPLGNSLLPSSLSRTHQGSSLLTTSSASDTALTAEVAVGADADYAAHGTPANTERRWSRVFKLIAGGGGTFEPEPIGVVETGRTTGEALGSINQEATEGRLLGNRSNETERPMFQNRARHQVDSGSLASFRGLDASPTLRVMNPDHGDDGND